MPPPASKRRPIVSVVEDDPAVLNSLEFSLEAQGYDVRPYALAQAALSSPEIGTCDCLVIDYALPDGDGVALLNGLRLLGARCPAIIIASTPTARCRRDAEAAGVPLVEKPLLDGTLEAMIRKLLKL